MGSSVDGLLHRRHPSGLHHAPQMHIHDSNEIMPDFIGKLTVGKYSPERVAPEMFGRGFTDSASHITNESPTRGLSRVSSPHVQTQSRNVSPTPTSGLLLDQYLKVESYVKKDADISVNDADGMRSSSKSGNMLKDSPKRVEIPMLSFGDPTKTAHNFTFTLSSGYTITNSPPKSEIPMVAKDDISAHTLRFGDSEEDCATVEHPTIAFFDDSAPSSAAIGAKRPLPLPLTAITGIADKEGQHGIAKIEEAAVENSRVNTPRMEATESAKVTGNSPAQPFTGRSFADLSPELNFEHKSVEGAVPAYALRTAVTPKQPPKSPGGIAAVVVREKGNTVSSPNIDAEEEKDVFELDFGHTERSLGQESSMSG